MNPFLQKFFANESKNTCDTLRAELARASKIWLWIFNACFTQFETQTFVSLWLILFLFGEFDFGRLSAQSNSIPELSSIEFYWSLVRLGLICYAGKNIHKPNWFTPKLDQVQIRERRAHRHIRGTSNMKYTWKILFDSGFFSQIRLRHLMSAYLNTLAYSICTSRIARGLISHGFRL